MSDAASPADSSAPAVSTATSRRLLVTAALPYANGPIHIGHMLEFIQTDIWARFQRLRGHRVVWAWADDTHGTSVMMRARREGRPEEELIADMAEQHQRDFRGFGLSYDHYGSTNSEATREYCHVIWQRLREAGLVESRDVKQLYDPEAETFLADRFVRGTCPNCGAADQNGDSCEKCGATYSPADLVDPTSVLSGAQPVEKSAEHLFVRIDDKRAELASWIRTGRFEASHDAHAAVPARTGDAPVEEVIANYLEGQFLSKELRAWDVSRPAPYFGFEIPDAPGHYWYVWFDAPIGYIGSMAEWCRANGETLEDWWKAPSEGGDESVEVHHFIGKDITYFHTLFWPAMLHTAGFRLPTRVRIHGFLTVNGEKMSKSRGTFITAETYLKHLDPAYLRYYFASKLGTGNGDLDLDLDDFRAKVDSDLVGKVVNIASRCAKFVQKSTLAETYPDDGGLFAAAARTGDEIAAAYEACDLNGAMRRIMVLADAANAYIDAKQPWVLRKDPDRQGEVRDVCSVGLNLFRQLVVYLAPVLPELAAATGDLLGEPIADWSQSAQPLEGTPVAKFRHLMQRVDPAKVHAMIEDSKDDLTSQDAPAGQGTPVSQDAPAASAPTGPLADEPLVEDEISIDDLFKVDLRVARVEKVEHVEGADKLLQLTLSLGDGVTRNVFAGLKAAYTSEQLEGRLVVYCANLKPRKMKFGLSEGMVLAAGPGKSEVFVLSPDSGAKAGQRVH